MEVNQNLLNQYKEKLFHSIPVISGMDVSISEIQDSRICLKAPLDTNINYEGTAFGGSLNTLCILSAYLLTHHLLKTKGIKFNSLVIQNSSIEYRRPVDSDFTAKAEILGLEKEKFLKIMLKKKIARVSIKSVIYTSNSSQESVVFHGRFVAKA